MNTLQKAIVSLINSYQRSGGGTERFRVSCNFEPSCSEYTKQAVTRYGVMRGVVLALQRLRRCNDSDLLEKIHDPLP